jgi:hypothetical protein
MIIFFPARESLVSDIPAGDGKIVNIFYSVGRNTVPRRRIRVRSSLKEMSMEHLGYFVVLSGKITLVYRRLLARCLKTT